MMYSKGVMYSQLEDNSAFEKSMLKAIDYAKELNNYTLHATCLIALSQKAKELDLYDQQYKLLSDAYGLFDNISSRTRLKLLIQLSSYHAHNYQRHKKEEDISLANDFVHRGIALADSMGNKGLLTDLWVKLLHLKDIKGQFDNDFLTLAQRVLDNGTLMNDPFYIYKGNLLKAIAYTESDRPKEALKLADPLLKYARILNRPIHLQEAYNVLKNAAQNANNYKLALEYSEQFIIYNDSINLLDKAKAFTDAIQKYESEKKEKEILKLHQKQRETEFLAKQKDAQLKQNLLWGGMLIICFLFGVLWNHYRQRNKVTQLQFESSQNEQKLLRSQMNPHFLFNSLNSIKRFYIDGRIDEANDFMADFGNLLRQILEQSSKPFISIEEELEFLTLYLELEKRRFKKELNYTIHFDKDDFDFEDQIPSLILQPLVENSIWHGIMKSDKDGEITITVEKIGDDIKCSVLDNGIGYYSKGKSKTHSYTSRGLQLIKERIGKKGKFEIKSVLDTEGAVAGTIATLIFKPTLE